MAWPKGKPKIGSPKAGRKGYEIENAQLERMRRILDRDMAVVERFQKGRKISQVDKEILMTLQVRVSRYLDKLHASKQQISGDATKPFIIQIAKEIADQNGIKSSTENNSNRST